MNVYQTTLEIYDFLLDKKKLTRDHGREKTIKEIESIIQKAVSNSDELTGGKSKRKKYTKSDMIDELVRNVKAGKIEAAKLLAELEGFKSQADEIAIITVNYTDIPQLELDQVIDDFENVLPEEEV
jgi:predicted TIM-barrel fold metal-dependent hydrolase